MQSFFRYNIDSCWNPLTFCWNTLTSCWNTLTSCWNPLTSCWDSLLLGLYRYTFRFFQEQADSIQLSAVQISQVNTLFTICEIDFYTVLVVFSIGVFTKVKSTTNFSIEIL